MSNRADVTTGLRWRTRVALALMALLLTASLLPLDLLPVVAAEDTTSTDDDTLPAVGSEVIIVLANGEDPQAAADALGVEVTHIYTHVFNGFAGVVREQTAETSQARSSRKSKPKTKQIALDGPVAIESQIIPTGVSRAGVPHQDGASNLDIASPIDADIAIIDSGIAQLPDLNVQGGYSCIGDSNAWQDDNGHGSSVAGIAAAIDNNIGVVGVAPGARLWAVKALDSSGGGSFSDIICGLDWVAANADVIDVANLSLSGQQKRGSCTDQPLHIAVCAVVNAGVQVVVAAGNQGTNADQRVPASYPEVITVSGIADSDGKPGGLGPKPCFATRDDVFLNFTNYGPSVDIAAPGACIVSYDQYGSLGEESGTSEAAPHVAGAIANYVAQYAADHGQRPTPDQSRNWLLTTGSRPQSVDGVTGDKDSQASRQKAKKQKIKKLKKKVKNAKNKKARKKAKKKLKKARKITTSDGYLEPVLWLESLT
ncbi:MAG: S8 family serine peptidase [Thermomicrobiales bacterium]|nr:S8 family serine peptidase [Thermomicrobiales bacterium]